MKKEYILGHCTLQNLCERYRKTVKLSSVAKIAVQVECAVKNSSSKGTLIFIFQCLIPHMVQNLCHQGLSTSSQYLSYNTWITMDFMQFHLLKYSMFHEHLDRKNCNIDQVLHHPLYILHTWIEQDINFFQFYKT